MNDLIVIPQLKNSIIARLENEVVTEIGKIDISFNSKSIITKNNLIISLCFESKTLYIHNILGELLLKKENTNYKAINFKNNIVYLGGKYENNIVYLGGKYESDFFGKGEMFSVMNLEEVNLKMNTIDLPIKVIEGKSIDDILINGTNLILVDNILHPKYLIRFDISSPENPDHKETIELPINGAYEHIIKGDINNDWIIIYSSTDGREGYSEHITVSGKTKGHLCLCNSRSSFFDEDKSDEAPKKLSYVDISLVDSYLYILRTDGLGYIDLNKKISNKKFKLIKTKISNVAKIIKSQSEKIIAVSEIGYELIK